MRTRLGSAVLSAAIVMAVSSCTSSHSSPSATSTSSASSIQILTQEPHLSPVPLHVAPADLHSDSSWTAPLYSLQWPSFAQAPALSRAINASVADWRKAYVEDAPAKNSDFSMVWEPVANAKGIVGVRFVRRTTGADSGLESSTLYGDDAQTWTSIDLISPDRRDALTASLRQAVASSVHESPLDAKPADVLTDLTFDTNGDLLVRIPQGALASMSKGTLYARITHPESYLSDRGRPVREAVTQVTTGASSSASSIPAPATQVDCTKAKCIALTFDDGPGKFTDSVLDTLEKTNSKATFFMLGPAVQAAPDTVRRMARLGMSMGDHTWTHADLTKLSSDQVTQEISRQATMLEGVTGQRPIAVRPPFGAFTKKTPHVGYPFVLWDVDTEDWKNHDVATTTQRALKGAHRGAIILMHDIHATSPQALPGIISSLKAQGYTLVTIHDLLPSMSPTGAYYSGTSTGTDQSTATAGSGEGSADTSTDDASPSAFASSTSPASGH